MKTIHYLLLFCIICCPAYSSWAAPAPDADENIHINADRMNQSLSDGVYTAEGNVVVLWKGMKLVADRTRYTAPTHMLYASGSVVLTKEATVLKGETLVMDMETGRAEINPALLMASDPSMNVTAEKLIRINENLFTAISAELTTCDIPDPSWKIGNNKLNINLLGYATGWNVIFYIKDVPVFYLPWIAYPVVRERRSGLLIPQVGYSKTSGMKLGIPLYLVISPSQDLTLNLDIMTKRGIGTGLDYRYIRSRNSRGDINTYSIYDQLENKWRWELTQSHTERFPNKTYLRLDINTASDRTFLSDFSNRSGDYNRQSSVTSAYTSKTWQNYAASAYLRYTEDLYAANNRSTLQNLPSLGVSGVRQAVFSMPLYFDIDVSADNFYRQSSPSGQRLYSFPKITLLPFQSSYIQTALFAGTHIRGYATGKRDNSSDIQATDWDLLPEAGARLSTSLTRIYDAHLQKLSKIRHEIIPELRYSFVPERNQQSLPLYDSKDRITHLNLVSLSVTNLVSGKFVSGETTDYRDISRIKLSAEYAIDGGHRDLLAPVQSKRPWSDLMLDSETWLTKQIRVTFESRYNLYENHLSTVAAGIDVNDQKGNSVGAAYQVARNEVEYFESRLTTRLIKPMILSYTGRYSFDLRDFLESVYTAEYRHKCWSVNLALNQRPGNQSFTVNFNLAGL